MAKININQTINNTVINVGKVEHLNTNPTTVNTTIIYGSQPEETNAKASEPKPQDPVETAPIRDEILLYVSCLRTKLAEEWKSRYQKVWADILDLEAVSSKVYDPGKQQGTNFNRNLVANIVHYLNGKGAFNEYNAAKFAFLLEGTSDHSVRAALGSNPNPDIVSRLDRYFET